MTKEEIQRMIEAGLPGAEVVVKGDDGQHFEAVIISDAFEGKLPLQRHRMVYATLGDHMQSTIHALSMKTQTPAEARSSS